MVTPWGIAFIAAMLVTWSWSRRNAAGKCLDNSHIDLLVPLALALGVAGAWGWWQLSGFRIRLFEVMVCSAAIVFMYSRVARLSFRDLLDVVALPVLAGVAVQRIGCLIAGCCWGHVATHVPGIEYPVGSFAYEQHMALGLIDSVAAMSLPVHAVQIYEIVVLLAVILLGLRVRWSGYPNGTTGVYAASAYAVGRFILEFFRADSDIEVAGLTIVQFQAVGLLALVILAWQVASTNRVRVP